jgi:tetratricopeptide (TPR) repeat protein
MPDSASKELTLVKELINEYKIEEGLQHVNDIEQNENLTPEEALRTLYYKGLLYNNLGQPEIVLKISEELYQKSQELKMPLFSLDALFIQVWVLHFQGKMEEKNKLIEQYENIFKSIPREDSFELQERETFLWAMKGNRNFLKGNFDLSLEYLARSLSWFEGFDPHSFHYTSNLVAIAMSYYGKGELKLALEYIQKALSLIPEGEYLSQLLGKGHIYLTMGNIFYEKGNLDRALEYFFEFRDLVHKMAITEWMPEPYINIIRVVLAQNKVTKAQKYLEELKLLVEKHEPKFFYNSYQIARSLILKSSPRTRDRAEAENILKKILDANPYYSRALTVLCDLYFEEFQQSNHIEILDDIHPLTDNLQRSAIQANSYSLLANVKLLQAKVALLQINMVEARKLLTEAQKIAEEHDLQRLAGEISREHDHLLEKLKLWESFEKEQASVPERLKLASIDNVMERMQGKRAIEVPEVSIEEPILLLIMDKSGAAYFNHSFVGDWDFDDLFSSFMSAFNTFSGEIFSNSIDRVKNRSYDIYAFFQK